MRAPVAVLCHQVGKKKKIYILSLPGAVLQRIPGPILAMVNDGSFQSLQRSTPSAYRKANRSLPRQEQELELSKWGAQQVGFTEWTHC